jgi:hypothetical protein
MPDALFYLSLDPLNPFFSNTLGIMPPSGEVLVHVSLPAVPGLAGLSFFIGGATLDAGLTTVLATTNSHRATIK